MAVEDRLNDRVRTEDAPELMRRIHTLEDKFTTTTALAVVDGTFDDSDNVYLLSEDGDFPVSKYTKTGTVVAGLGTRGTSSNQINVTSISRITWGAGGHIYVFHLRGATRFITRLDDETGEVGAEWSVDSDVRDIDANSSAIYALRTSVDRVTRYLASGTEDDEWNVNIDAGDSEKLLTSVHGDSGDKVWVVLDWEEPITLDSRFRLEQYTNSGTEIDNVDVDNTVLSAFAWPSVSTDSAANNAVFAAEDDPVLTIVDISDGSVDYTEDIGDRWVDSDGTEIVAKQDNPSANIRFWNFSGTVLRSWEPKVLVRIIDPLTEWFRYPTNSLADKESIGEQPVDNAFFQDSSGNRLRPRPNEIVDMRDAIEALAPKYKNAVTGNPFNWTVSSADNLYNVAVTSGQYDWSRPTTTDLSVVRITEEELEEIEACIEKLEASNLV